MITQHDIDEMYEYYQPQEKQKLDPYDDAPVVGDAHKQDFSSSKLEYKPSVMSMVQEFADTMGQKPNPELSADLITEEYMEWQSEFFDYVDYVDYVDEVVEYDPAKEIKELSDLLYVVYGYANARGWDLDEAVRRVHENNMGRCIQPDGSIKRRGDGKIIKRDNYPKVSLEDLV